MAEQPQPRRRSFDEVLQDSLAQWTKRFERALEEQRQVIGTEAEQRSSDIARLTLDQLEALEQVSAEKVAQLEQIAVDYREASERALAEKSSEVEHATREQVDVSMKGVASAFDKFAGKRLDELEDALRGRLEKFRQEMVDQTHRVRDVNAEQLNETRSLVTSETRQLEEQAVASQDEMRRVAAKEAAAFDELARERITELRDLLGNQTELLAEFARTHESTIKTLEEQASTAQEEMRRVASRETTSFTSSFEALARERISELQDLLGNQTELLAEFERRHESSSKKLEQQTATAQDEMRRVAAIETASSTDSFDTLSRERISELQNLVGSQTELLTEFTRTHEAASAQLDEARTFTTDTMARLSRLNDEVARHNRENEESAAAAARVLKQASATEINSIQQRAMAMNELAAKLTGDIERRADGLLEAESSTAEGLHAFEQQLEARRAEIESLVEERVGGLTEQVRQAEATAVRRINDLGGQADASLGEQKRQLENTRSAMQSEFREIRRADGAALQSLDARLTKLVEMIAATQVTLDQLTDRVQDLETVAAAPLPAMPPSNGPSADRLSEIGPSADGPSADALPEEEPEPDEPAPDEPTLEASPSDALPAGAQPSDRRAPAAPTPNRPAPRSPRPDLRDW
ncbi:MAG TPA: hypothetical protein VKE97_11595 [Acidimicrobiia bacterium]|nr:hypothetical protein [Acidimicrobiia bacterium]